jgi:ribosomal protein L29
MANEAIKQFKSKSKEALTKELTEMQGKLWTLTSDLKTGKVKNVREIKDIKKNIARIHTVMNEK